MFPAFPFIFLLPALFSPVGKLFPFLFSLFNFKPITTEEAFVHKQIKNKHKMGVVPHCAVMNLVWNPPASLLNTKFAQILPGQMLNSKKST